MKKTVQMRCLECWSCWIGDFESHVRPRAEKHREEKKHVGYGVLILPTAA